MENLGNVLWSAPVPKKPTAPQIGGGSVIHENALGYGHADRRAGNLRYAGSTAAAS